MLIVFMCPVHQAKHQTAERKPTALRICFLDPIYLYPFSQYPRGQLLPTLGLLGRKRETSSLKGQLAVSP